MFLEKNTVFRKKVSKYGPLALAIKCTGPLCAKKEIPVLGHFVHTSTHEALKVIEIPT
jgi:hypothetical protein